MIHARAALISHIRTFVETELAGLYRFDDIEHYTPETSEPNGKRVNPYGKFKEIAEVRFGNYHLAVKSSHEAPPVGSATLTFLGKRADGPLDAVTWRHFGTIIREREGNIANG